jgi:hypothetical protein
MIYAGLEHIGGGHSMLTIVLMVWAAASVGFAAGVLCTALGEN